MSKPRNVRNYWLDARIDGRETRLQGGPAASDGAMDITLKVRDHGEIVEALDILCRADNGTIRIKVQHPRTGEVIHEIVTQR